MTTRQHIDTLFEIGPPDEMNVSRDQAVRDWQAALHSGKSSKELQKDFELYGKRLAANYARGKGSDYSSARKLAAMGKLKETLTGGGSSALPHIRIIKKAPGRQFYRGVGTLENHTLCGAEMTDRDMRLHDARKSAAAGWKICPECLRRAGITETLTGYGSGGNVGGSTSGTGGMEADAGSEIAHQETARKLAKKRRRTFETVFGEPSGLYGEPKEGTEHIVSAAVRNTETGDIYLGDDHEYCYQNVDRNTGKRDYDHYEDGFYTSEDRFLSRRDAFELALNTGQGSAREEDNEFEHTDGSSENFYAVESIDRLFERMELPYGYWVSRSGTFTAVEYEQHESTAEEMLGAEWDSGESTYKQMYDRGFVRVLNTEESIIVAGDDLTNAQRRELTNTAIESGRRLLWEKRGLTSPPFAKVLYHPSDTEVVMSEGWVGGYVEFWLDPSGTLIRAPEGHAIEAAKILGCDVHGGEYQKMYDKRYARIVRTDRGIYAEHKQPLSAAQFRTLKDVAIEYHLPLHYRAQGADGLVSKIYTPDDVAAMSESPEVAIDNSSKKAIALAGNEIKHLHDMPLEDMRENIVIIRQPEGSNPHPLIGVGSTWVYFMDSPKSAKLMKQGKIPYLMVPVGTGFHGGNPITDVWTKRFQKPGTEHILGLLQGHSDEKSIYIDMMSVRTAWRRNRINSLMIDALRSCYPKAKLEYSSPTQAGEKFIKGYSKPEPTRLRGFSSVS